MLAHTRYILIALIILSMLSTAVFVNPAHSFPNDQPAIVVEPATVNIGGVIGQTFSVNLTLYNVTVGNTPVGLAGLEVHLAWNTSVIQPITYTNYVTQLGGVSAGQSIIYGLNPGFRDSSNKYISSPPYTNATTYAVSYASTSGGWWGNGLVATINFTTIGLGTSPLDYTFTDLQDLNVNEVPHYVQNGTVINTAPVVGPPAAFVYVSPSSIINSALTPSSLFAANVSIQNATNLANFTFSLDYLPSVIQVVSATWPWAGSFQIDNVAGVLNGSTAISPYVSGNTTLVQMMFNVTGLGQTSLHLHGIVMYDNNGAVIPYSSADGYFSNLLATSIYVDPSFRRDLALTTGSITSFGIVGKDFLNISTVQFDLKYNPSVIWAIGTFVVDPQLLSLISYESVTFNNTAGDLNVTIIYAKPVTTPLATLVNVTFYIVAPGISPLNLNSTTLLDSNGNSVGHQSGDGLLETIVRDVAVTAVSASPTLLYPVNRNVTIAVTVANLGNMTESFNVTAYVDGNYTVGTVNVPSLAPQASMNVSFVWNLNGWMNGTSHIVSAQASLVPYEYNVTNNYLASPNKVYLKLLGDINGDGTVSLQDLILLAQAYGYKSGQPKYNPEADINGDGTVNLTDLVSLAQNYGKTTTY